MDNTSAIHRFYDEEFEKRDVAGVGTFGEVATCRHVLSNRIVAIKTYRKRNTDVELQELVQREMRGLLRLRPHQNVLTLLGVIETSNHSIRSLVFPHYSHPLDKRFPVLMAASEPEKIFIFAQILTGVKHLHDCGILHRDLKPANIMIAAGITIKIIDVGISGTFFDVPHKDIPERKFEIVTLWYRAPELIMGEWKYKDKIDMWSIGCIFAEFYLSRPLFNSEDKRQVLQWQISLFGQPGPEYTQYHETLRNTWMDSHPPTQVHDVLSGVRQGEIRWCSKPSRQAQVFLRKLLQINPESRLSASTALADNFIAASEWVDVKDFARRLKVLTSSDGLDEAIRVRVDTMKKCLNGEENHAVLKCFAPMIRCMQSGQTEEAESVVFSCKNVLQLLPLAQTHRVQLQGLAAMLVDHPSFSVKAASISLLRKVLQRTEPTEHMFLHVLHNLMLGYRDRDLDLQQAGEKFVLIAIRICPSLLMSAFQMEPSITPLKPFYRCLEQSVVRDIGWSCRSATSLESQIFSFCLKKLEIFPYEAVFLALSSRISTVCHQGSEEKIQQVAKILSCHLAGEGAVTARRDLLRLQEESGFDLSQYLPPVSKASIIDIDTPPAAKALNSVENPPDQLAGSQSPDRPGEDIMIPRIDPVLHQSPPFPPIAGPSRHSSAPNLSARPTSPLDDAPIPPPSDTPMQSVTLGVLANAVDSSNPPKFDALVHVATVVSPLPSPMYDFGDGLKPYKMGVSNLSRRLPPIDRVPKFQRFYEELKKNEHIRDYDDNRFYCYCESSRRRRAAEGFTHHKRKNVTFDPFAWSRHSDTCKYLREPKRFRDAAWIRATELVRYDHPPVEPRSKKTQKGKRKVDGETDAEAGPAQRKKCRVDNPTPEPTPE